MNDLERDIIAQNVAQIFSSQKLFLRQPETIERLDKLTSIALIL